MQTSSPFTNKTLDDVKSYWNSRPCNLRHSQQPVGSREYFDEVEARKYFVEPPIPAFADFPRWKGKKVLEVGCGIGTDTINFARAGAQVTAVDLSEASLKLARQRSEVFGLQDRITFYQANAEQLSQTVPVQEYDLVYSFGVIHHTPHPELAVQELSRYMGPQSTLKLMVYNRFSWKVLWILLKYGHGAFWKTDELVARYSEANTGCPVTYSYSAKSVCALLKGFELTNVFAEHIFPYSIPEYTQYQYKKVWYFRMLPQPLFRLLEKTAGWHLCVEGRLAAPTSKTA